ncbi:XrtA/PEP-CTERM system exopolysaccharide export protein [Caulobacter sp. AP07]|uniref:XrtA/PEP-CTERM system exopolysaccharide export protein n=1 Tax=Caulobacter sp. AP07 TaxID=1144304 RepID=UPI001EE66621|nr:XrtA/PEP-CTERM system exopolysaccharide export protein [Caulobacter sp. AP07]
MEGRLSGISADAGGPSGRRTRKISVARHWKKLGVVSWLCAVMIPLAAGAQPVADVGRPAAVSTAADYLIGPGDLLQIFVWKNPDLSVEAPVRPDGRITTPLVPDIQAQGRRPTELAANLQQALSNYIQEPVVTVVVKNFAAPGNSAAVRVIGAAVTPKTVPYRAGLTALDVLIDVGGLTVFANGNGAKLLRRENGAYQSYPLRLKDLVRSGDLKANVNLMPGDIIRIPERMF